MKIGHVGLKAQDKAKKLNFTGNFAPTQPETPQTCCKLIVGFTGLMQFVNKLQKVC